VVGANNDCEGAGVILARSDEEGEWRTKKKLGNTKVEEARKLN